MADRNWEVGDVFEDEDTGDKMLIIDIDMVLAYPYYVLCIEKESINYKLEMNCSLNSNDKYLGKIVYEEGRKESEMLSDIFFTDWKQTNPIPEQEDRLKVKKYYQVLWKK
ncbi:MAG: hypothetical protein GWP19_01815 [Planctomycetia bacterium]|nr:hypothetical protein [Planctomycetia bacterium]